MAERRHNAERRRRLQTHPRRPRWTDRATAAVKAAADVAGVSYADALGARKYDDAVMARSASMLALYDAGMTYEQIAVTLCFDYTTVGYLVRRARPRAAVDLLFRDCLRAAERALGEGAARGDLVIGLNRARPLRREGAA